MSYQRGIETGQGDHTFAEPRGGVRIALAPQQIYQVIACRIAFSLGQIGASDRRPCCGARGGYNCRQLHGPGKRIVGRAAPAKVQYRGDQHETTDPNALFHL
jgi:hypothetical protein